MIGKVKTLVREYNDLVANHAKMSQIATKYGEILREVGKTNADSRRAAMERICSAENPGLELCRQYCYSTVRVADSARGSGMEVRESIAPLSLFDFYDRNVFSPEWMDCLKELYDMFKKRTMLAINPSVGADVIRLHFGSEGAEGFEDIPVSNRKIMAKLNEFSLAIVGEGYKFRRAYMGVLAADFGSLSHRKHVRKNREGDKVTTADVFDLGTTVFPTIRRFAASLLNVLAAIVQDVPPSVRIPV